MKTNVAITSTTTTTTNSYTSIRDQMARSVVQARAREFLDARAEAAWVDEESQFRRLTQMVGPQSVAPWRSSPSISVRTGSASGRSPQTEAA